jgi:CTP:molybdopterin cytidylyltransferase MocA
MKTARIGVVVLAAGESRRFGAPKLVAPIDGVTLIRRVSMVALDTGARVVVVTGAQRELVESQLDDLAITRAFNADWPQGMGSSIACGVTKLAQLDASLDAVIVVLGDQPRVGSHELQQLIAAHLDAPTQIIAAQYAGVLGPPCLFPCDCFGELQALHGTSGARELLQRHASRVRAIPMPAAAIDIDTPEDYERVTRG